jgi:hypothetical protein
MTNTSTISDPDIIETAFSDLEDLVAWVEPNAERLDAHLDEYARRHDDKTRTTIKQDLYAYITRATAHYAKHGSLKVIDANTVELTGTRKLLKVWQRGNYLVEGKLQELYRRCVGLRVLGAEEWREASGMMWDAGVDLAKDYRIPHHLISFREGFRALGVLLGG